MAKKVSNNSVKNEVLATPSNLNSFIPKSALNRLNKFNSDLAAFAATTGEVEPTLYEDTEVFYTLGQISLVNGRLVFNYDGAQVEEFEDYNLIGFYEDTKEAFFNEDTFNDFLSFHRACLRRAKKYWSMSCEELDKENEKEYGYTEEEEETEVSAGIQESEKAYVPAIVEAAKVESVKPAKVESDTEFTTISAATKKAVKSEYEEEKNSPFAVLNWINSNGSRDINGQTLKQIFKRRAEKKLQLTDLFQGVDADGKKFVAVYRKMWHPECLDTIADKKVRKRMIEEYEAEIAQGAQFDGVHTKCYAQIAGRWYKVERAKFNVIGFIDSYNCRIKADKAEAKEAEKAAKIEERENAKAAKAVAKEAEKRETEIKALMTSFALLDTFADMPESQLYKVAAQAYDKKQAKKAA